ncbi:cell division protein FtsI [Nakamurella flavida]|uniref:Cell division protein FtsI n=1 Tax=Nakamurella flavida TaxID=363630 RepID=A0A938YN04_9ACTN|nr:penicillin-binding protein 2 [Nakamurella flavida]MBM9477536.1 cell division protein FtsI [Nakamurella flavida]MDP9777469.1 cell division protein FtsI (penicillin-binding protein 3) [Nakamurella flavida]
MTDTPFADRGARREHGPAAGGRATDGAEEAFGRQDIRGRSADPRRTTSGRATEPRRAPSRGPAAERTPRTVPPTPRARTRPAVRPAGDDARQGARRTGSRPVADPVRSSTRQHSVRGRRQRQDRGSRANTRLRGRLALWALVAMMMVAGVRLVDIQVVQASTFAAQAASQSNREVVLPALRGSITDRNGTPLAFTVQGRAVAARPALYADDAQRRQVAEMLVADLSATLPGLTVDDIMTKLTSGRTFVYLARGLMPAQADAIVAERNEIFDVDHRDALVMDRMDIRQTTADSPSAAIVGGTDYDGNGVSGIEAKFDSQLAGENGKRTVDVDAHGQIIPNTARDETAAQDGTDLQLTVDSDLQYVVQQKVAQRVAETGAKSGCAVVMTVKTGEIAAMACAEPGKTTREVGNKAVTDTFEPGSVNKVVTMAAAIEQGLITPTTVMTVDGSIKINDVTVKDAWSHGPIDMTATGILAKSSNVGTLMIAQEVGPDAFMAKAKLFGQGVRSGVQLPSDAKGVLPDPSTWSSSTFANLPIGQGVSMNLVQLAGMYQAIANDGVRITPTLVRSMTENGVAVPVPTQRGLAAPGTAVTVMSPETAHTLRDMLRGTVQDGDTAHRGTAPAAAITGYQVAGKTGTAQQVDPETQDYSQTVVTTTFGGFVPADDPVYSIALMLDAPNSSGPGGSSAAPLFHEIAAYAMRQADVPPSATAAPVYDLYVGAAG